MSVADQVRRLALVGVADAQVTFGQMLLDGTGVAPDPARAFGWFLCAAQAGHPMAQNMLGRALENGWGVPHDIAGACLWYRRAAEAGLDWGMYNHATQLVLGRGTRPDRAAAFGWFSRATALGHAKSANILGGFFEDGWEVAPDRAHARALYQQASDGGDFRGHFNLGRFLLQEGRPEQAHALFRSAASTATEAFRQRMQAWLCHAAGIRPPERCAA